MTFFQEFWLSINLTFYSKSWVDKRRAKWKILKYYVICVGCWAKFSIQRALTRFSTFEGVIGLNWMQISVSLVHANRHHTRQHQVGALWEKENTSPLRRDASDVYVIQIDWPLLFPSAPQLTPFTYTASGRTRIRNGRRLSRLSHHNNGPVISGALCERSYWLKCGYFWPSPPPADAILGPKCTSTVRSSREKAFEIVNRVIICIILLLSYSYKGTPVHAVENSSALTMTEIYFFTLARLNIRVRTNAFDMLDWFTLTPCNLWPCNDADGEDLSLL